MKSKKRASLEKHGWQVGEVSDFLGSADEEVAYIELKLALSRNLKLRRERLHLSQEGVAKRIHSSQSRVAKMEGADPSVSIDLLMKTLFALGATPREVGLTISKSATTKAA